MQRRELLADAFFLRQGRHDTNCYEGQYSTVICLTSGRTSRFKNPLIEHADAKEVLEVSRESSVRGGYTQVLLHCVHPMPNGSNIATLAPHEEHERSEMMA